MLRIFLSSFIISVVLTYLAIITARKLGVLDYPDNRKIHEKPTPLLGGLAIFGAYVTALLMNFHFSWELKGVIIASGIILFSGLVDDIRGLPAWSRLIIQILCTVLIIYFGVRLKIVPNTLKYSYILDCVITVFWMVGITNAMNFLDGLDGLSAGVSFISTMTFFIIAVQTGQNYFAFLNIALAGACLGFLLFNFRPARIFLGDAGSSFLGFSLAALAVMGDWSQDKPVVAFSIPLLVLSILIFDMIYISISRIIKGKVHSFREWIDYVGKDHLHHRLMGMGFSRVHTVLIIYLINLIFALGVLVLLVKGTVSQALILIAQGICILTLVAILMVAGRAYIEKVNGYNRTDI
jgi:UDP-GlcNAc:undecaprenyl-phosphate GlcNAc-1-phosphate transferase